MGFAVPGKQGLVRVQCQGHNHIRRAHCIYGPRIRFRPFLTKPCTTPRSLTEEGSTKEVQA
eukprot:2347487-Prorocentrum_lima.AAC.1